MADISLISHEQIQPSLVPLTNSELHKIIINMFTYWIMIKIGDIDLLPAVETYISS